MEKYSNQSGQTVVAVAISSGTALGLYIYFFLMQVVCTRMFCLSTGQQFEHVYQLRFQEKHSINLVFRLFFWFFFLTYL